MYSRDFCCIGICIFAWMAITIAIPSFYEEDWPISTFSYIGWAALTSIFAIYARYLERKHGDY